MASGVASTSTQHASLQVGDDMPPSRSGVCRHWARVTQRSPSWLDLASHGVAAKHAVCVRPSSHRAGCDLASWDVAYVSRCIFTELALTWHLPSVQQRLLNSDLFTLQHGSISRYITPHAQPHRAVPSGSKANPKAAPMVLATLSQHKQQTNITTCPPRPGSGPCQQYQNLAQLTTCQHGVLPIAHLLHNRCPSQHQAHSMLSSPMDFSSAMPV